LIIARVEDSAPTVIRAANSHLRLRFPSPEIIHKIHRSGVVEMPLKALPLLWHSFVCEPVGMRLLRSRSFPWLRVRCAVRCQCQTLAVLVGAVGVRFKYGSGRVQGLRIAGAVCALFRGTGGIHCGWARNESRGTCRPARQTPQRRFASLDTGHRGHRTRFMCAPGIDALPPAARGT
jgi:hypothetical protein